MADFGGRYRRVKRLGAGGMGEVWLAFDEELDDRPVAIKVMRSDMLADPEGVARFQREIRMASRMRHPNIVTVFPTGTDKGDPFLVMEYLKGRDLGKMPPGLGAEEAARIGRETCAALAYAHGLDPGVVHRDIKPGNLFICDGGLVKVTDFGLAKAVSGTKLTASGTLLGTFPYMSPEQWLGEPAAFSNDVWAVGCVLYELLSGRLPRPYTTPADHVAAAARGEHVTPLARVADAPMWLTDAVMGMLQPDPRNRPSAAECVQLLSGPKSPPVQQSVPARGQQTVPMPARAARKRRKLLALLTAGATTAMAASAAAWFLTRPTWIPGTGTGYVAYYIAEGPSFSSTGGRIVPVNLENSHVGKPIKIDGSPSGMVPGRHDRIAYVVESTPSSPSCLYCTNLVKVDLVTGSSGAVSSTIKGDDNGTGRPYQLAVSKDGKTAYVTSAAGVVPIDLKTRRLGTAIPVGNSWSQIALSPDGKTLYVTGEPDKKTGQGTSLVPIDLATGAIGHSISFRSDIEAVAVAPDGYIYVYDQAGFSCVNPHTQHIKWQLSESWAGGIVSTRYLALTPDGQSAYVSADNDGGAYSFDNMVIKVNLRTHQAGQPIHFNNDDLVTAIAASPDSKMMYVGLNTGSMYPIDVTTNRVGKAVALPEGVQSLVIAP